MIRINNIKKYIVDRDYRFMINALHGMYDNMPDDEYLRRMFKAKLGYELDLDSPKTFNEKLQWLKIHDHNPVYTNLVDKYEVKEYVASIIGKEYIIPTLGLWSRFDDIDFDSLPNQFVIKCTHDSGGLVIVKDKKLLNINDAKKKIESALKRNYYYYGREWPYKNVKPRIIVEEYMHNNQCAELIDYKFMCFNGEVKYSFVCTDRYSLPGVHTTFFDREWNMMPFIWHYPKRETGISKPQCYDEMIYLAEKLSTGFQFTRIDFYEVDGKIKFSEFTFYPGSGFEEFTPTEWDYIIGDWLKLNK